MLIKKSLPIIAVMLCLSCNFFKETDNRIPVARVGESYLYQEDIENIVAPGTKEEDSILLISNFITRWATQELLMDGAKRNLPEEQQTEFNKLVTQYKNDLFTKAYLEALVYKHIDTIITVQEAQNIYEANKETFKLNEELVKLRYLSIPLNAINKDEVERRFKRYDTDDKTFLDGIALQFKSYSFNDTIWVKLSQAADKIPAVNAENKNELLKKSNFIQLKDSLNLYLMQINDVLKQNDYAPLEYVKPTIDQIIINKRKLELIKQLEKDITKDATRNNQFEIYN